MKLMFCLGSLNKGGAERVVCNLANYFAGLNDEVVIIVTKLGKKQYTLDKKIKIYTLDVNNKSSIFRNIRRISKLHKIIVDYKPDIVLGFLQEPIARLLTVKQIYKDMKKIPIIISVRIDPKTAFNTIKRKLSLLLYNKANGYVFQTKEAKCFFKKEIQQRSVIIANSINPIFFKQNNNHMRDKKIVSVGRLTEQKNFPLLIDAYEEIAKEYPDYKLEIYGDGPLRPDLQSYIEKKGLKNTVFLKGQVDDIKEKIENATIFVMTSNYEGMSNALMEAMALGVPVISTDSSGGGAKELIKDGKNGFLVPVNNVEKIIERMRMILKNPKLANTLSENEKKDMKNYSPQRINAEWQKYIKKIASKKGK